MNKKLAKDKSLLQPKPAKKTRFFDNLPKIDIAAIEGVNFHRNTLKKENTIFVINLYEINRILKKKTNK